MDVITGATQYVNVDGIRTRYVRAGAGPCVLLLHGMIGALSHWEPVVAPLAVEAEVVALDLPPFGASDKPPLVYSLAFYADFLTRFATHLGLRDVTLVGHSFGGKVAAYTAAMHPEWVAGLVLVAADGFAAGPEKLRRPVSVARMRALCAVAPRLLPLAGRLAFPKGTAVPPALFDDARAFFRDADTPRALAAVSRSAEALTLGTSDAAPRLATPSIPVEIVQGTNDRGVRPADARRAATTFPRAHLALLPGVGHLIPIERPVAVVEAVRAALAALAALAPQEERTV